MDLPETKTTSVGNCARCKGHHEEVTFTALEWPLKHADLVIGTHWAPCPINGQPIIMRFEQRMARQMAGSRRTSST